MVFSITSSFNTVKNKVNELPSQIATGVGSKLMHGLEIYANFTSRKSRKSGSCDNRKTCIEKLRFFSLCPKKERKIKTSESELTVNKLEDCQGQSQRTRKSDERNKIEGVTEWREYAIQLRGHLIESEEEEIRWIDEEMLSIGDEILWKEDTISKEDEIQFQERKKQLVGRIEQYRSKIDEFRGEIEQYKVTINTLRAEINQLKKRVV